VKVFKFDPITGRRGELIEHVKRASWAAGFDKAHAGQEFVGFGADSEVCVHVDAGIGIGEDEQSYRRDEWVCFCLGCWQTGTPGEEHWEWVVLAPKM
jgi:hypothetical protein